MLQNLVQSIFQIDHADVEPVCCCSSAITQGASDSIALRISMFTSLTSVGRALALAARILGAAFAFGRHGACRVSG